MTIFELERFKSRDTLLIRNFLILEFAQAASQ